MRRWWPAALAAIVLPLAVTVPAAASGERPPDCQHVTIVEPVRYSLPLLFCGGVRDAAHGWVCYVDGSPLKPHAVLLCYRRPGDR
jgi:hypothetical protein